MLPKITHSELRVFLDLSFHTRQPLLITGAPGLGKTVALIDYCQENGINLVISHPVISMPEDFKGLPIKTEKLDSLSGDFVTVAEFLPFDDLQFAIETTEDTIWFFDDMGQAPFSVQAACMQIIGGRSIAGKSISDTVRIVAATNRREDLAGVKGLLEPVKSRFGMIIELVADTESFTRYAHDNGLYTTVIDYLNFAPESLHDFKPNIGMENSPCPRLWEKLSDQLHFLDNTKVPADVREKVILSCVGEAHGRQYSTFESVRNLVPSYGEVVNDPHAFQLPERKDILFAFCGMLARQAQDKHHKEVFAIIDRLPGECQMYVYRLFKLVNEPMLSTVSARRFATDNIHLFMPSE